jgi:outer membrane protein
VSLGWTLFDFGARRASLDNAQALLAAALANQNAALQTSFQAVTKDYYAAQAASGAFMAAEEIARMSQDSLAAAKARVDHAVAPISDALQAETARDQAVINVSKMRGAMQAAIGALAADMDLRPDTPLSLPAVSRGIEPDAGFDHAVGELIEAVRNQYPAVVAAEAQLKAARAKVAQTKAEGRPNVGLVAKYSANNQPASLGLGIPEYPARGEDAYVGVQVSIPLFEGFGRTYQVRQAQADAEHQQDVVEEARQHAGLEVWNDFQTLQSSTEIAQGAAKLLAAAQQSFDAARGRYVEGVGNVLELLSAQTALANAKQQHIQALTDWRASRLRLAGSLGDLQVDGSFR